MKTKYYLTMATVAAMFAACTNNESVETDNGPVEAQITAGIDGPKTRAIDENWSENNTIGVRVTAAQSDMPNMYKNVPYKVNSGGSTGIFTVVGEGIFFQDADETVTFSAYSPYKASADNATLPDTDGTFTGENTQNQQDQSAQEAFDYLFASGATASKSSPQVEFKDEHLFQHKMARLILVLKTSTADGFTADKVFDQDNVYKLGGLKHNGTFNMTDGTATATGEAVSDWNITGNYYKDDKIAENTRTYTMILYPQTLGSALAFSATIDGETYTNTAAIQPELAAGNSYTYTVTIKKTGLEVSGCTIEAWNEINKDGVEAVM